MMPGEEAEDESLTDVERERTYKINVHNVIMDTVNESIDQRFLSYGTLSANFALLDPKHFAQICSGWLPRTALLHRLGLAYVPLCHVTWAPTGTSNGPLTIAV